MKGRRPVGGRARARWIVVLALAAVPAFAAVPYPDKPIRLVVPFAPGGGNDLIGRLLGSRLGEAWSQQIVVDNRGGAGGNIAAETAARAAPDGYTLFLFNSANAIAPSLYRRLAYDPIKDFDPVILAATAPFAVVVHPSMPVQSINELIAMAKAKPGTVTYASGGNGSSTHLATVLFTQMAGVSMVHIPYKGAGPALVDLLAGQVTLYFASIPPAIPHVKAGRLRALAITSKNRFPLLPELPTLSESGVPDYRTESTYGITVPVRTPPDVVRKLNAGFTAVLADSAVRSRLEALGTQIGGGTPHEYGQFIRDEVALWAKVVKVSGAKVE